MIAPSAALNLFDYAEAKARRDEGMARAEANSPTFADLAYEAIVRVARRQVEVHVDHILAEDIPEPHHPNAFGAVWMRAIRSGIIQRTNQVRRSKDPRKHAHSYPIYWSLLYDPRSPG